MLDQPQAGIWHLESREGLQVPAGGSAELLVAKGTGRIERFWMTLAGATADPKAVNLRDGRLEISWDGASTPAVAVPVGDFFGLGHGLAGNVQSDVIQSTAHGLAAYWPMPFSSGARVVFHNDASHDMTVFAQIGWTSLDQVSNLRFQTSWRRNEHPQPGMLTVADIHGRGHYVGTVLAVSPTERSWFGEGDDVWIVDGVRQQGTGTEDWLNQAWFSLFAQSSRAGGINQPGRLVTLYRFNMPDVVRFSTSLQVQFEQQGFEGATRSDDVAATAFWYQEPPLSPVPPLPPAADRRVTPVVPDGRWTVSRAPAPIDIVAAAVKAGVSTTENGGAARLELNRVAVGPVNLAGVAFTLGACTAGPVGRVCGVPLNPTTRLDLDVPAGSEALYLLVTAEGAVGSDAFKVRSGSLETGWRLGREVDAYGDPWKVPHARGLTLSDEGHGIQAAYVGVLPLRGAVGKITIQGVDGARAVVWGAAAGALPSDYPSD